MMSFVIRWFCCFILCTALYDNSNRCDAVSGGGVQVEYSTTNCKCKGIEIRRSGGSGPRTLKLNCRNNGANIHCEYTGNPHGCSKYYNGGQETFYQQVLNSVGSTICSLPANNMICPRGTVRTKICGDLGSGKDFVCTAQRGG